jgi:TonB family protein
VRTLPRSAISLYVAVVVHALVLLVIALPGPSQDSSGPGQGLSVRAAPPLSVEQRRLVAGGASVIVPGSSVDQGSVAQLGGGGRDLYFARLRAHLSTFRRDLSPGLPAARCRVHLAITRDGWVAELALVESSGVPELDAAAMDLVRRAAPLPAPPGGRTVGLIVPVEIGPAGSPRPVRADPAGPEQRSWPLSPAPGRERAS